MSNLPKAQLGVGVEGCTSSPHTANSKGWHTLLAISLLLVTGVKEEAGPGHNGDELLEV